MTVELHDPSRHLTQLRQILSADKLSIGFFLGAGCPCAVRVKSSNGDGDRPLIPDIRRLTSEVGEKMKQSQEFGNCYQKLTKALEEDGGATPTVEMMLNRVRALRDVVGKSTVRSLSHDELEGLDREICKQIRAIVTCDLPADSSPYLSLASYVRNRRQPYSEIFTTNYDLLMEQALERERVPYFDGFIGSSRPFFDQRAIEDDEIPQRWSRLWKLHGSINWRYIKNSKAVVRSELDGRDTEELLVHPSHTKYDESRRMPYYVMIDRLRSFLRNREQPVALMVMGYSFGDQHLNEAIIESLKANASSACFALQYGNLGDYAEGVRLAKENANLSLLARDGAIIRCRSGLWVASPATELASLKTVFETVAAPSAGLGTLSDPGDTPHACNFLGGDFKRFGDFLDELAAYDTLGSGRSL